MSKLKCLVINANKIFVKDLMVHLKILIYAIQRIHAHGLIVHSVTLKGIVYNAKLGITLTTANAVFVVILCQVAVNVKIQVFALYVVKTIDLERMEHLSMFRNVI